MEGSNGGGGPFSTSAIISPQQTCTHNNNNQNSASLRAALSLLEALLRQQTEDALLPLLQGLPPRLLPALLRALVATVNLPSNVRRQISDLLHLLLGNNSGSGSGNGPLPRASGASSTSLSLADVMYPLTRTP